MSKRLTIGWSLLPLNAQVVYNINLLEVNMLSIVIPCHNEAGNIDAVINRFVDLSQALEHNLEVILVNDASTDGTEKSIEASIKSGTQKLRQQSDHARHKMEFKTINIDKSKGYGHAILSGLGIARGDILAWTHADMQTDPSDLFVGHDLWMNLQSEEKKDFIIKGARMNRKPLEILLTFGMSIVVLLLLRMYLSDINAQPKMFSRKFYNDYLQNKGPYDFSLDLYTLYCAKKSKVKIYDFPVFFKDRLSGEAKGGGGNWKVRFKLIKRTLEYIWMTSIHTTSL